MTPLRLGIAGLGTVAQGLLSILKENGELLAARAGRSLEVTVVASRTRHDVDLLGADFTHDVASLVTRNDVDVVIELIGGDGVALDLVRQTLQAGRSVVTANKAILAGFGNELFGVAAKTGATFGFEASVAGGIPVISALNNSLVADDVAEVVGIINGTCNYILTAMAEKGEAFDAALDKAQALGYAEADPTFDVGGIDAAHKLTILASLAFDVPFDQSAVYVEGIESITTEDITDADALGYRIKHLGVARRTSDGVEARVHPVLVPKHELVGSVNDVMNAVQINGNATGTTLYCGPGAGGRATASAVLSDIVAAARGGAQSFGRTFASTLPRLSIDDAVSAVYLRIPVVDEPGVFAQIATVLSRHGISIEGALQREHAVADAKVPIVVVSQPVQEAIVNQAVTELQELPQVVGPVRRIRVEHLDG